MKLSIVATLFRSAAHLDEFHRRSTASARAIAGDDYEIVLVNDGSPDDSLERAVRLSATDPHMTVVDLSRNFGHHKAMMTGLSHSVGELVFLIDSDLEEEPEWLMDFAELMARESCDVVYGVQERRKGNVFERWTGQWFYWIFNALTGLALPENSVTARLMSRRYVNALLGHDEREIFIAGLWHITGFSQHGRLVTKHATSASSYTLRHKLSLLVNAVTSFSNAPLIAIFYTGIAISLVAAVSIAYLFANWLFMSRPMSGWTSVMASIWLIGGLVISFIGVVGIYLSKIFIETKRRPYTIVRSVFRGGKE